MDESIHQALAAAKTHHDSRALLDALEPILISVRRGILPGMKPEDLGALILGLARALSRESVLRAADDVERARLNLLEVSGYSLEPLVNMTTGDRVWIARGPGAEVGIFAGHPSVRAAIDSIQWRPN